MGPALNISTKVTASDLDAWIGSGMTCLEVQQTPSLVSCCDNWCSEGWCVRRTEG